MVNVTLSIVIPAYNAAQYLKQCIESVLAGAYTDYEVLLIDDGSTDATGTICDQFAEKYEMVRTFHTENRGLAEARNLGLEHARGEYIGFVDADDLIHPRMFEMLVSAMEPDVQMAACRFIRMNEKDPVKQEPYTGKLRHCNQTETANCLMKESYGNYVWNKLFRKALLDRYQIRFPENCRAIEDVYFTWNYIQFCDHCVFLEDTLYCYVMHDESIMNSFRNRRTVGGEYMDLPRGSRYCAGILSDIAPQLEPEGVARTAMFYQTVLRKLEAPSEEYIQEAVDYVRRNCRYLRKYSWGWKYYSSALVLAIGYPIWAKIFRRRINDR